MTKYLVGFAVGFALWVIILGLTPMPEYRIYNCDMAEWHPDIPPKVKKECRELKQQQWKPHESQVKTSVHENRKDIRRAQSRT